MPRFRPIEKFEDLPVTADARESFVLDFKATVDPGAWWELAKDIAALANHVGGTLVIGAREPVPGNAPTYHGLEPADAEKLALAYERVVAEHCLPRPIVRPVPVELPGGRQILAVNVEPFPDQPVGSRVAALNRQGQPEPSEAWRFPVRVGRDTRMLGPDHLPLLTSARVRRNVIFLEMIPQPFQFGHVSLVWRFPTHPVPTISALQTLVVSPFENLVTAEFLDTNGRIAKIWIPLDDVETVWRAGDAGWQIRVAGFLHRPQQDGPLKYMSVAGVGATPRG